VLSGLAEELALAEPVLPWHTARARIAGLGAALAIVAGTLSKVALDVALLAQTEVGEVAEPSGDRRGGSSTLPHKRNPIGSALTRACARRVQALAPVLLGAMEQEHERAAGAWHAEWETLRDALAITGGAASSLREVLEGLEVHPERMRANLELTGGLLLSERVAGLVAERGGGDVGRAAVEAAAQRAAGGGGSLREELEAEPAVCEVLSGEELDAALDPAGYEGCAETFVERALEAHRGEAAG
jgi:3-carboxy-cis,cis-muconate cycloisomerase